MNKIDTGLYLGNLQAAYDLQTLKSAGITHILQVAHGIKPLYPKDFIYKIINVPDAQSANLIRHFPAANGFIKSGMQPGGVLVHCFAGVSRSATCVIAFLMQDRKFSFQEAFAYVSKRRPIVFPNMGF